MKESLAGDNQFECNTCCTKTDADTWLSIEQTSEILILLLKRFTNDGISTRKKSDPIKVPLSFIIRNMQYELFAFVLHVSQDANYGHYV